MRYISNNLLSDEKIVFESRPHWIIFGTAVWCFIFACVFWAKGGDYSALTWYLSGKPIYEWATIILFIMAAYFGVTAWVRFISTEYGVTNKRVVMKTGLIQRDAFDTFLTRVEGIKVQQSVLGRFLNFGTIAVIGTGGTNDAFYSVPQPLHFRRMVQEQMDREMGEFENQRNIN